MNICARIYVYLQIKVIFYKAVWIIFLQLMKDWIFNFFKVGAKIEKSVLQKFRKFKIYRIKIVVYSIYNRFSLEQKKQQQKTYCYSIPNWKLQQFRIFICKWMQKCIPSKREEKESRKGTDGNHGTKTSYRTAFRCSPPFIDFILIPEERHPVASLCALRWFIRGRSTYVSYGSPLSQSRCILIRS